MCPCVWFRVFGPSFHKLSQYTSSCKAGITHPTGSLDTRVRCRLMLNKDLRTLDYFSCVPAFDLSYSGLVSRNCAIPGYLWSRYISTHREPRYQSKLSLDVKQGAEDFGLFFICRCTWFGVFRSSLPKLPQYASTCETGIARLTELDASVWYHFMWNKD